MFFKKKSADDAVQNTAVNPEISTLMFNASRPETISFEYDLTYDDIIACLKRSHAKAKKKRLIQSLLLAAIFGLNLYWFIKNPSANSLCGIVALIAAGFAVYIFAMPFKWMRDEAKMQADRNRHISFSINDEGFYVTENGNATTMEYYQVKKCIEDAEQVNIYLVAGKIFLIPKRVLNEAFREKLTQILSCQLAERYSYIAKRPK